MKKKNIIPLIGIINLLFLLLFGFPLSAAFTIGLFISAIFHTSFMASCIFGLIFIYFILGVSFLSIIADDVEQVNNDNN